MSQMLWSIDVIFRPHGRKICSTVGYYIAVRIDGQQHACVCYFTSACRDVSATVGYVPSRPDRCMHIIFRPYRQTIIVRKCLYTRLAVARASRVRVRVYG